ncbi:DNA-processing protein DprA [Anianabacter salinae]|uniref:DNA-processing protein DprA n=1 Tax=Anianabacter salinae TaxID=2851023 RepID=UPI0038993380
MAQDLIPSPTPLTPPRSDEDWLAWFRLLRSRRVGPATFYRLMSEHGSAQAALAALPGIAAAAGVDGYAACPADVVHKELHAARLAGALPIARGDPRYPAGLNDLPDAPPILWTLGRLDLMASPMIALVGARNASSLGTRMARKLAEDLGAAGYTVVSGLARGIDTAAHMASLKTGTLAVMAGGVDVVYPPENAALTQEIGDQGLRLSEQPMGLQPHARHFPARNRLVSGLARAVIVVEAAAKSGSLITARTALDQGREVLAVPGHPVDARAAGCNMLIRDGAILVRSAADVIEAVGAAHPAPVTVAADQQALPMDLAPPAAAPPKPATKTRSTAPANPALRDANRLHNEILSRLGPSPLAEDQLIRDLSLPAHAVAPELVRLELDGRIERRAGGLLTRV